MIPSSFEIIATQASPHDFTADVRVFEETARTSAFVTLDLGVGPGSTVRVFLPATSYHVAASIAELWPTLADKGVAPDISAEALARLNGSRAPIAEVAP